MCLLHFLELLICFLAAPTPSPSVRSSSVSDVPADGEYSIGGLFSESCCTWLIHVVLQLMMVGGGGDEILASTLMLIS